MQRDADDLLPGCPTSPLCSAGEADKTDKKKLKKKLTLSLVAVRRLLRQWWSWTSCCPSGTTRSTLSTTHWKDSGPSSPRGWDCCVASRVAPEDPSYQQPSSCTTLLPCLPFHLDSIANHAYKNHKPCLTLSVHMLFSESLSSVSLKWIISVAWFTRWRTLMWWMCIVYCVVRPVVAEIMWTHFLQTNEWFIYCSKKKKINEWMDEWVI